MNNFILLYGEALDYPQQVSVDKKGKAYYKFNAAVERESGISRQNIGEILRVNGMRSYDEHKLLLKNEGRSCQDEFYIEHM